MEGVRNLVFDSTGIGFCDVAEGFAPTAKSLTAALVAGKYAAVEVTSCKVVELPLVTAEFDVDVKGLA